MKQKLFTKVIRIEVQAQIMFRAVFGIKPLFAFSSPNSNSISSIIFAFGIAYLFNFWKTFIEPQRCYFLLSLGPSFEVEIAFFLGLESFSISNAMNIITGDSWHKTLVSHDWREFGPFGFFFIFWLWYIGWALLETLRPQMGLFKIFQMFEFWILV